MFQNSRIFLVGVMGVACAAISLVFGQTKSVTREIRVEDIGRSVTFVGRLGKPLGVKIQVRGRWAMPDLNVKDYSPRFTVTEVDGNRLSDPVEFNIAQVTATTTEHKSALPDDKHEEQLDGQQWSMIAYETGRICVRPDEYGEKQRTFPVAADPYYTKPFTSELVAVVTTIDGRTKR